MAPSIMPTLVHAMLIVVHVGRQTLEVPQMTSPQERQLKEQKQKVKKEHDTRFPKSEEHLQMDGDAYEYQIDTIRSP